MRPPITGQRLADVADRPAPPKLRPPAARHPLVARPRLLEALDRATGRVILLAAPAGFGKTTVLAEWAMQAGGAAVAWLSLEPGDDDPTRFWTALAAALRSFLPEPAEVAGAEPDSQDSASAAVAILDDLGRHDVPAVLVLDDYHVVHTPAIHEGLSGLLERLPAGLRVVLSTRTDPPLRLARLRARGDLCELRVADLRFTPAEAADLLGHVLGQTLPPEQVAALEQRTEGWAAGLQLAGLALRGSTDLAAAVRSFAGSHRFVIDYLVEEVVTGLPEHVQAFLLETAILDQLCAPLCDAVTGDAGGQAMLEWLERANLFLVPLDDAGHWYRYHHLFADALRQRLRSHAPQRLADLHGRAAAWFQAAGRDEPAVEHLLAGGDWSAAAELMARLGSGLLERGEHATLWRWLARLPAELRRTTPAFSSTYALSLLLDGRTDALQRLLDATEPYLDAQGRERELGNLLSVRATYEAFREDTARTATCVERAHTLLPAESVGFRSMALLATARAALLDGETARAEQSLAATQRLLEAGYVPVAELHARLVGAALDVQQGRLRRAASTYQNVLALLGSQTGFARNDTALRLASIYHDWLRLDAAAELVEPVLADVEGSGRLAAALPYDRLAHLLIAHGELERAASIIRTGEAGGQALRSARRLRRLAAERARLALACGETETALIWARARLAELDALRAFPRLDEAIVLVRVLLSTGDTGALEPVAGLLDGLIEDATLHRRLASLAELLGLQALVRLQLGQRAAAEGAIEQALQVGEPEELARHVVEGGPSMLALLRQALGRGLAPRYLAGLVQRFAPPAAVPAGSGASGAVTGLLSPREQEVLQVLAEGLSTREIAQRLVVSEHTVKTHLQHLSAKLGAGSRTHLLARAHELGLLEARRAHRPDQPFGGWPAASGGPI